MRRPPPPRPGRAGRAGSRSCRPPGSGSGTGARHGEQREPGRLDARTAPPSAATSATRRPPRRPRPAGGGGPSAAAASARCRLAAAPARGPALRASRAPAAGPSRRERPAASSATSDHARLRQRSGERSEGGSRAEMILRTPRSAISTLWRMSSAMARGVAAHHCGACRHAGPRPSRSPARSRRTATSDGRGDRRPAHAPPRQCLAKHHLPVARSAGRPARLQIGEPPAGPTVLFEPTPGPRRMTRSPGTVPGRRGDRQRPAVPRTRRRTAAEGDRGLPRARCFRVGGHGSSRLMLAVVGGSVATGWRSGSKRSAQPAHTATPAADTAPSVQAASSVASAASTPGGGSGGVSPTTKPPSSGGRVGGSRSSST